VIFLSLYIFDVSIRFAGQGGTPDIRGVDTRGR
jgi:hypothetical protein